MSLLLRTLITISKRPILLPFYHLVTDGIPSYSKHLYQPRTTAQFSNDIDTLLNYYKPIALNELIAINQGTKKCDDPCFHLTFDDGLANFYHSVAPILKEKKVPATVFLNTNFIDNKELFYRFKASLLIENYHNANTQEKEQYIDFLQKNDDLNSIGYKDIKQTLLHIDYGNKYLLDELAQSIGYDFKTFLEQKKPYLSTEQIKELQQQGFTFGTHSCDHPAYSKISLEEQLAQTRKSLAYVQTQLDADHKVFSFPFDDVEISRDFFNEIQPDLELSFGTSGIKKDSIPFNLQRLDIEKSSSGMRQILIKNYGKYLLKIIVDKNKMKRR